MVVLILFLKGKRSEYFFRTGVAFDGKMLCLMKKHPADTFFKRTVHHKIKKYRYFLY